MAPSLSLDGGKQRRSSTFKTESTKASSSPLSRGRRHVAIQGGHGRVAPTHNIAARSSLRVNDPLVQLLNAHTRDGSADHQLLDLLGAFEDVEALNWASPLVPEVPPCCR